MVEGGRVAGGVGGWRVKRVMGESWAGSARLELTLSRSSLPQSSRAVRAEKSSDRVRKILVRNVWRSVRQESPGRVDLRELMLCVATMGMHFGWRERLKNFSSPVGSFSPTVAKCWYSSQTKKTWRK